MFNLKLAVIIIAKELVELANRKFKIRFAEKAHEEIVCELQGEGLSIVENFLTEDKCSLLRDKIDLLIEGKDINVWSDSLGADKRIYFVNELDEDFDDFYNNKFIRKVLESYTGIKKPVGMLLAARIDAVDGNVGSGGGWHRDSPITHQFKAVCYLSDVAHENGPFQYIKGSHLKSDVLRSYIKKLFKFGQYRFTDNEIDDYLNKSGRVISEFSADKGTLAFSDTKGIHRGKPIESGNRYVLFCYFWEKKIPAHFTKLNQKHSDNR